MPERGLRGKIVLAIGCTDGMGVGKTFEKMTEAAPWEGRYRHMGLAYPLSKKMDTGILAIFGG